LIEIFEHTLNNTEFQEVIGFCRKVFQPLIQIFRTLPLNVYPIQDKFSTYFVGHSSTILAADWVTCAQKQKQNLHPDSYDRNMAKRSNFFTQMGLYFTKYGDLISGDIFDPNLCTSRKTVAQDFLKFITGQTFGSVDRVKFVPDSTLSVNGSFKAHTCSTQLDYPYFLAHETTKIEKAFNFSIAQSSVWGDM
jgi:hypothetical protein